MNSSTAVANDVDGWLLGANIGQSTARIDDAKIRANLLSTGLTSATFSNDEKNIAFKLFGGYKFNRYFAVEGGYFDLGQFGYTATTVPAGSLVGTIKIKGINLDAVGMLPIDDKFSAFARVGLQYGMAKDTFANTGAVAAPLNASPNKNAANLKAGIGLQYNFDKSLGLRLEGERYRINDAVGSNGDINMLSLGVIYKFGKDVPPPVKPAPPPVVVAAPAPAPAPVFVIVPVKIKTAEYCSILDLQFEIKQDAIQREDKEKLAVVGTFMQKYPNTTAIIEGHTDDIGTAEFNQKLSEQRAESVVSYLVNDMKIDSSRLTAVGYGSTLPIADNSTREGKQANRRVGAVIACATDIADLKVLPARATMALEIGFDAYKHDIQPMYYDGLREVASFLKANPTVTATVEGHASKAVGMGKDKVHLTPEESMVISQARATAVVNYLVDTGGIARSRLSTSAFGQTRRVSYGTTLEGQHENSRVNIMLNYKKQE
jgi:OOP family OmpA-OmpF porin